MKKLIVFFIVLCLLLAGCSSESPVPAETTVPVVTEASEDTVAIEPTEAARIIIPLPDTTMENLTDAILSVSLEEGGAYVDDTGKMQMDLKIYTYDKYDMVDIANLKVGDILFGHTRDVTVTSIERNDAGTVFINGGLDAGGTHQRFAGGCAGLM